MIQPSVAGRIGRKKASHRQHMMARLPSTSCRARYQAITKAIASAIGTRSVSRNEYFNEASVWALSNTRSQGPIENLNAEKILPSLKPPTASRTAGIEQARAAVRRPSQPSMRNALRPCSSRSGGHASRAKRLRPYRGGDAPPSAIAAHCAQAVAASHVVGPLPQLCLARFPDVISRSRVGLLGRTLFNRLDDLGVLAQ